MDYARFMFSSLSHIAFLQVDFLIFVFVEEVSNVLIFYLRNDKKLNFNSTFGTSLIKFLLISWGRSETA